MISLTMLSGTHSLSVFVLLIKCWTTDIVKCLSVFSMYYIFSAICLRKFLFIFLQVLGFWKCSSVVLVVFVFFFYFFTHFIFFCRLSHALGVFQHSWSIFCQVFSSYFFNFILNLFCHFFFIIWIILIYHRCFFYF